MYIRTVDQLCACERMHALLDWLPSIWEFMMSAQLLQY